MLSFINAGGEGYILLVVRKLLLHKELEEKYLKVHINGMTQC